MAFILSMNLVRRHLKGSQRAMVAAKLMKLRQGARTDLELLANWREVTKTEAAQLLNIGERSVERAKKVLDNGTPEVQEAVERGDLFVRPAAPAGHRCLWCEVSMPPRISARGSPKRFCSKSCRQAFHGAARRWAVRVVELGALSVDEIRRVPEKACTLSTAPFPTLRVVDQAKTKNTHPAPNNSAPILKGHQP